MRHTRTQSRRHAPSDSQESPRPLPAAASAPTFQRPLETTRGGSKMVNKISALIRYRTRAGFPHAPRAALCEHQGGWGVSHGRHEGAKGSRSRRLAL